MAKRWFENDYWNAEIENLFFTKLSRARKEMASQYLRIQSIKLLRKTELESRKAAIRLMEKLFSEYQDQYIDICFCHNALAEYYYENCNYFESYRNYKYIRDYNIGHSQTMCNYTIAEIGLIKNIIKLKDLSKYKYAKELIIEIFPSLNNKFFFLKRERKEYLIVCEKINEVLKDSEIEKIILTIECRNALME